MKDLLTPKQVARAIQVSESSVKRWCDKGVIPTQYTAGGHRRIPMDGLISFLRATKHDLIEPEVIGLPAATGKTERSIDRTKVLLIDAFVGGRADECRQLILDLYFSEHSISRICDQVISPAFEEIGDRWECGDAEVYQERRACEICSRLLHELRSLIPTPAADAPVAIGGATEGDTYSLATTAAELVLRDLKWNATTLGGNLPFATLDAAIRTHKPQLFWLSVSHLADEERFVAEYQGLYDAHCGNIAFVVGGRALIEQVRQRMCYAAYCDNMQHLQSFAETLLNASAPPRE